MIFRKAVHVLVPVIEKQDFCLIEGNVICMMQAVLNFIYNETMLHQLSYSLERTRLTRYHCETKSSLVKVTLFVFFVFDHLWLSDTCLYFLCTV